MFRCFGSVQGKTIVALVAVLAICLVVWHSVHLAAVAPLLLFLACPLMHVVMHKSGRGGPHHHEQTDGEREK